MIMKEGQQMSRQKHFLVSEDAVPPVFSKVLQAKELLATGQAKDVTEVVKMVGISRSVYYKYYRKVQGFSSVKAGRKASINIHMKNIRGTLTKTLDVFASRNMNILTIFQGLAIHSVAVVQIMIDISEATVSVEEVLKEISSLENIISVELQSIE